MAIPSEVSWLDTNNNRVAVDPKATLIKLGAVKLLVDLVWGAHTCALTHTHTCTCTHTCMLNTHTHTHLAAPVPPYTSPPPPPPPTLPPYQVRSGDEKCMFEASEALSIFANSDDGIRSIRNVKGTEALQVRRAAWSGDKYRHHCSQAYIQFSQCIKPHGFEGGSR